METTLEKLTWGELKKAIEKAGTTDETPICHLDISAGTFYGSVIALIENGELDAHSC